MNRPDLAGAGRGDTTGPSRPTCNPARFCRTSLVLTSHWLAGVAKCHSLIAFVRADLRCA